MPACGRSIRMEQNKSSESDSQGRKLPYCVLHLPLQGECCASTFNLESAVCNHGFFMMAPNLWIPSTKTLQRPLRLADATSVTVSISHPPHHTSLLVHLHNTTDKSISSTDRQAILAQVGRMLRISEKDERDVRQFQMVHPQAKQKSFGRLFRSPTLFEDAVKSILLCNCKWDRSLNMAQALCRLQSELVPSYLEPQGEEFHAKTTKKRKWKGRKRKRESKIQPVKAAGTNSLLTTSNAKQGVGVGNFPSSKELAALNEDILQNRCNLGYRARHILRLARKVESGKIQLKKFEAAFDSASVSYEQVYEKLMKIKGLGPFACANILMCIGCYQRVPADTETVRHLREIHGKQNCSKGTIGDDVKEIYEEYAPFQCLAYWLELCDYYEKRFGKLSEVPNSSYHTITGSIHDMKRSKSK